MDLNNTAKAKKEILFFNRVPKVGSQTTMELLKSLSHKNNFMYHKDRTQKVETIKLTYNEEKWLANLVNYFELPSVYVKHVCLVDFTWYLVVSYTKFTFFSHLGQLSYLDEKSKYYCEVKYSVINS